MCYIDGSIDQATSVCPMCRVYRPSGARCPHRTETCRNMALHPLHDVVHFKNAEVQNFNGCGYCKWARQNPTLAKSYVPNPGWPGCCRPPTPQEYALISAADWPAVSIVFRIAIPPDIKALLDSLNVPILKAATSPTTTSAIRITQPPPIDRRSTQLGRTNSNGSRNSPMAAPLKARSGGSPLLVSSSLGTSPRPNAQSGGFPSPNGSPVRRSGILHEEKRTTPPASIRKSIDSEGVIASRSSERRPSLSAAIAPIQTTMPIMPTLQRRATTAGTSNPTSGRVSNPAPKAPRLSQAKVEPLEDAVATLSIASPVSDSSSDGGSSIRSARSAFTVTSDGGFTDYLSDESEAELQKQVEARVHVLEQNRVEEQEFRIARQQLVNVDLRPPQSWNPKSQRTQSISFVQNGGDYLTHLNPTRSTIKAGGAGEVRSR